MWLTKQEGLYVVSVGLVGLWLALLEPDQSGLEVRHWSYCQTCKQNW